MSAKREIVKACFHYCVYLVMSDISTGFFVAAAKQAADETGVLGVGRHVGLI